MSFLYAKHYVHYCPLHSYLPKLLGGIRTRQDVIPLQLNLIRSPATSDSSYVTEFCHPLLYLYTMVICSFEIRHHAYQLSSASNINYSLTSVSVKDYRFYRFLTFYKTRKSTDVIYTLYDAINLGWDINGNLTN